MTPLRQRFLDDLRMRNRFPHTQDAYVRVVAAFARHFHRSPDLLGRPHLREYLLHLVHGGAAWSTYNQARCALHFLYSELTRLKVSDIDSQRMVIRVRQGKGQKDRYVMLPGLAGPSPGVLARAPADGLAVPRRAVRPVALPAGPSTRSAGRSPAGRGWPNG